MEIVTTLVLGFNSNYSLLVVNSLLLLGGVSALTPLLELPNLIGVV